MKKSILFTLFVNTIIAIACSKQNPLLEQPNTQNNNIVYDTFAVNPPDTKTSYSQDGITWDNGDNIYYFSGPTEASMTKRSITIATSGSSSQIELQRDANDKYYVLLHNGEENPKFQQYGTTIGFSGINPSQDGTFASANISAAYTTDLAGSSEPKKLTFQNITTPLEFFIARKDIRKVVFKGNNKEYVNGRLNVDFTTNPYTVSRRSNYPGAKSTAPDSIMFSKDPVLDKAYYFNVMPQKFTKGFTIQYYGKKDDADYLIGETKTSSSVTFTPGNMKYISDINVNYTIQGVAKKDGWIISTSGNDKFYQKFDLDDKISVDAGEVANQGYYLDATNHYWRLYQVRGPNFTISAKDGYTIKSITFIYTNKNNGVIKKGDVQVTSGTSTEINAQSQEFSVGTTTTATNGSVAIKNIKVSYYKNKE